MAMESGKLTELLKYPITVFSILFALILAKFTLGINFGNLSEVGPGGVKFAQESSAKIADLEGRLGVRAESGSAPLRLDDGRGDGRPDCFHRPRGHRLLQSGRRSPQEVRTRMAQGAGIIACAQQHRTVSGFCRDDFSTKS